MPDASGKSVLEGRGCRVAVIQPFGWVHDMNREKLTCTVTVPSPPLLFPTACRSPGGGGASLGQPKIRCG